MIWDLAEIISQEDLGADNYCLTFKQKEIAENALPGQFVEISTQGASLLNKPISLSSVDKEGQTFKIIYKVVGPGTRALSKFEAGMKIKVIGPCGNGFQELAPEACIIGGGIGIPPMYFLAARYHQNANVSVILGARSAQDLVLEKEFEDLDVEVSIATDDGSKGKKGTVVDLLKEKQAQKKQTVYACGPLPMLRGIAKQCEEANVEFYACLEAYMGCGFGICVGCAIPTVRGMERVCKEGPVFLSSDVLWGEF